MSITTNLYFSPSGVRFVGPPTALRPCTENSQFAFFLNPKDNKGSICVIELWKKTLNKFLGIKYGHKVELIAVFRIKNK